MSRQLALVIDLDRCIGCLGGCRVACKIENNIALGDSRSKLYTMESGTYPNLEMYFIPVMCQQCENPSCAAVCPTGACHKSIEDGVISIDRDRCVGCQSCKRACPYDAMNFNEQMRVMDKCDICKPSRDRGEQPACVKNCAGQAIRVVDVSSEDTAACRQLPDYGNKPMGRFILKNARWKEDEPWKS